MAMMSAPAVSRAQRYATKSATVAMRYNAPHGLMQTENRQVSVGFDAATGEMRFNIAMLSFRFNGAYSQEQFDKYFKANAHFSNSKFVGRIVDMEKVDFTRPGTYEVTVRGDFTLRTITRPISARVQLKVEEGAVRGASVFKVNLLDFQFNLASSMETHIEVQVDALLRKVG